MPEDALLMDFDMAEKNVGKAKVLENKGGFSPEEARRIIWHMANRAPQNNYVERLVSFSEYLEEVRRNRKK